MPIRLILLLPLLLLAMAELAILVTVGGSIGILPTFLLLLGIGILGMVLVQRQGLAAMLRLRTALAAGRLPVAEAFDGVVILLAGLLLALPGLLSDLVGVVLLLPFVRRLLYKALASRLPAGGAPRRRERDPDVIEGVFEEIGPPLPRPGGHGPA